MSDLKQTPLLARHKAANAKTAPFADWEMPIQYEGILVEHAHTRGAASIFDICHMGEVLFKGPKAMEALSACMTHNLATLNPGRCRYGFLLNAQGGVLDDLIIYHLPETDEYSYMAVLNAACTENDIAALRKRLPDSIVIKDISPKTGKIDLQGPKSFEAFSAVCRGARAGSFAVNLDDLRALPYFGFMRGQFMGEELFISRTGYTGEFGYELYLPWETTPALWDALLEEPLIKPAGLGARDTLRLEAGLPLYGQDLDAEHTPAEAGYAAMLTSEAAYVGKGADRQIRKQLVALSIDGRRSARHNDVVVLPQAPETPVGVVTSGSFAPSLGHCIALAYVDEKHANTEEFLVQAAKTNLPAKRATLPFYTAGTARMKL